MAKSDLSNFSIPMLSLEKTALNYSDVPINLEGSLNKEPLVSLEDYKVAVLPAYTKAYGPYSKGFATALVRICVRETLAHMLQEVNLLLRPYQAEILALDGYRPISLQKELWAYFIARGKQVLENPSEDALRKFAGTYASDPSSFDANNFRTWPVHNTGGAVDVTLQSLKTEKEMYMGGMFDQADEMSETSYWEKQKALSAADREARQNRRLLYHAMTQAGFSNYAHEWWHYDYGTQLWAMNMGPSQIAFYGIVDQASYQP